MHSAFRSRIHSSPDAEAIAADHVTQHFSHRDASDLAWFLSIGVSTFERSTFGDMIERQRQFSEDHDGRRIPAPKTIDQRVWEYMQGRCEHPARFISQELADDIRALIPWDELDPRLTADSTGSSAGGGEHGYSPNHAALVRFAVVSRRLARIPGSHRRALTLYFGLEGARWVSNHLGQIVILYPETQPGRWLLEKFGQRQEKRTIAGKEVSRIVPLDGSPAERVVAIWGRNTGVKDHECSKLLRWAEQASYELLSAAKAAYGETL